MDPIKIFKGNDTNFNDGKFLIFELISGIDLSGFSGIFTLDRFKKPVAAVNGRMEVVIPAEVTSRLPEGLICGTFQLVDSKMRVATVSNTIPFEVTDKVFTPATETIQLTVPQNYPVQIQMHVYFAGGNYEAQNNLPSLNGVTVIGNKTSADYKLASASDLQEAKETLENALGAEEAERKAADETLQANIAQEAQTRLEADQEHTQAISKEISDRQSADSDLQSKITAEETDRKVADSALSGRLDTVEGVIPTQATQENQLADKGFVNSTVQTSTAHYRGLWPTFASVPTDASAYPTDEFDVREPGPNDYMVVQADETQDGGTWRYKYTGLWSAKGKDGWEVEYEVNETPLTAAQLAALDSNITAELTAQITTNKNDISELKTSKADASALSIEESARKSADTALEEAKLNKTDAANTYLSKETASTDYLKKTDAANTYVSKTGSETISGVKTFSTGPKVPTQEAGDNSDNAASTEYVDRAVNRLPRDIGIHHDGISNVCTRTGAAEGMEWSKSTNTVKGKDDFANHACFEQYDIVAEYDSTSGKIKPIAVEGTTKFDNYISDASAPYFRIVMQRNTFFNKTTNADGEIDIRLNSYRKSGMLPLPSHYRNGTLHEWIGYLKYGFCDDGNGGVCSMPGKVQKTATTLSGFNTLAKAKGLSVLDIRDVSTVQMLATVKYANMNWQSAIGQGFVSDYKECTVAEAETSATRVLLSNSDAAYFSTQYSLMFNSKLYKVTSIEDYSDTVKAINIEGTVTTTATSKVYVGPAISGTSDAILGLDGENEAMGSSGKRSNLVLGRENWFGSYSKYINNYVKKNGRMLINPVMDGPYDPPTASDNKGWEDVCAALDTSGWIKKFVSDDDNPNHPYLFVPSTLGGDSSKPVGDYRYNNTETSPRLFIYGGGLHYGSDRGPFCADLQLALSNSNRSNGSSGVWIPDL